MSDTNEQILARIKELIPINELSPNLQKKLLENAKILDVKKSRFIFKQGDKDDYSYYLLDGEVELHQNNQLNSVMQSGSDRAKYALAQLQPRQFSVKAKTEIKILLVERKSLDQLMMLSQESTLNPTLTSVNNQVEVDEVDGVDDDTDWMTQMLQSELFSRIPTHNIHQLFALLEPINFKAGDVVIKQGDPGEHYYIISEGRCAVSRKPSPQSKDVKLAELSIGDSFGEEALISESTRNATVTMITDGVLMRLAKDTFIELVKNPTLQSLKFDEAEALVNEGSAKWLDVRFPNEYKASSIEGSINIPLNSLRLQTDKLDPSLIYILYCDTGGRSSTGTFLLAERGFDVTYLDGGLLNNPEAIGEQTVVPKAPEPEPEPEPKPEPKPKPEPEPESKDELKSESNHEDIKKKLEEAKAKLEQQKKLAEAEAKKNAEQEEARLQKLKEESKKQMQEEKQKLEEIYNKNARDMEMLQKAKEEAEENLRKEREKLEQQAEEARKQIEEAQKIKAEAEASKKQLEEVEASKKRLEEEAEKKKLEDEEKERQLQAEAKASIAEERKKLAEQYERNSMEFEKLQKEKAATEAARLAAKEEAEKIIQEYKASHDKSHAAEEAKLKAERLKLEEEAKKIQETLKQIQQAKLEAEKMKQEALQQASSLKVKQMDSTSSQAQRDKLDIEIKAAEEKAFEAEREIEDAAHREKLTVSAKQVNEADLNEKKKQEQALLAQIESDLEEFEEIQEEEAASITQVQMQADMMKRIKMKAAEAKKKATDANESLLDDISKQLSSKD